MQALEKHHYSPEEYLALEETAEYKSEYYRGELFAMVGASVNHNQIVSNLHASLHLHLKHKPCRVFMSDLRLWMQEANLYTYPDLLVVCGTLAFAPGRNDTITNPMLIIEVLSESTQAYDRGRKFEFYRTLPTLKEYLLIDQYRFYVEQFSKNSENKWVFSEYTPSQKKLILSSLDFQLSFQDLYDKVENLPGLSVH